MNLEDEMIIAPSQVAKCYGLKTKQIIWWFFAFGLQPIFIDYSNGFPIRYYDYIEYKNSGILKQIMNLKVRMQDGNISN